MNKRDILLDLIHGEKRGQFIPAAFFMHFEPACHQGQAAIDKHLEFFRSTGMDFVKIQYEQPIPPGDRIQQIKDWTNAPLYSTEYFRPSIDLVKGLVQATKREALVVMTLYSPFMWARHLAGDGLLAEHLLNNPDAVGKGLEIMTENVLTLVRECKQAGVDGFYASTQGGESFRFPGTEIFQKYIKPTDLAVWQEIQNCRFNILHICDYAGGYDDLSQFFEYPGQVVNCSLRVAERMLLPGEVSRIFGRPFMGGLDRKGIISTGNTKEIRREVENLLAQAPDRFILAADCTVASETPWPNLKTAIDTAHRFRQG
jgi:uroporphyrinogen decarboxylase